MVGNELGAGNLEKGKAYLVIITTVSGFYRYRMQVWSEPAGFSYRRTD